MFTLVLAHVKKHWQLYVCITSAVIILFCGSFLFKKLVDWRNNVAIAVADSKAKQAEDKAANHEGRADAAKQQADDIERQRQAVLKEVAEAKREVEAGIKTLAERKRALDEARNKSDVDRSGSLDEREQRLLAELNALYPDN